MIERISLFLLGCAFVLACLFCSSESVVGSGYSLLALAIASCGLLFCCKNNPDRFGLGFIFVAVCAIALCVLAYDSTVKQFSEGDLTLIISGVLCCFLSSSFVKGRQIYVNFAVLCSAIVLGHLAISVYHAKVDSYWLPFYRPNINVDHVSGLYGHRNYLGNLLAGIGCLLFAGPFFLKALKGRFVTGLVFIVISSFVFWTGSRGAIIALAIGMVSVLGVYLYSRWIDKQISAKALGVILTLGIFVFGLALYGYNEVSALRGLELSTSNGREGILKVAAELVIDEPLFGSGARSFSWRSIEFWPENLWQGAGDMNYVHNEYLQLLVDYGIIVGGGSLLVFFGIMSVAILRFDKVSAENRAIFAGSFGIIVVFMVQGLVSFPLHFLPNLMLFMLAFGSILGITNTGWIRYRLISTCLIAVFSTASVVLALSFIERYPLRVARDRAHSIGEDLLLKQTAYAYSGNDFSDYRDLGDLLFTKSFQSSKDFFRLMRKANGAYAEARRLHPYDLKSQVALGVTYDYLGEFSLAEGLLRDAAVRGEVRESFLQTHRRLSQHYVAWGLEFYNSRQPGKAYFCFIEALYFLEESRRLWSKFDPSWDEERIVIFDYIEWFKKARVEPIVVEGVEARD